MQTAKIELVIEKDGELHLMQLPFKKGDRVEATISVLNGSGMFSDQQAEQEKARKEFLELAKSSAFHSTEPYPTRDELHERH
jgi:hypothetical protein